MTFVGKGKVARPDWMKLAMPAVEKSFGLYRSDAMPSAIERWMLVVPIKYALRAAYGCSNFRVALILLAEAVAEWCRQSWWGFLFRFGLMSDD